MPHLTKITIEASLIAQAGRFLTSEGIDEAMHLVTFDEEVGQIQVIHRDTDQIVAIDTY